MNNRRENNGFGAPREEERGFGGAARGGPGFNRYQEKDGYGPPRGLGENRGPPSGFNEQPGFGPREPVKSRFDQPPQRQDGDWPSNDARAQPAGRQFNQREFDNGHQADNNEHQNRYPHRNITIENTNMKIQHNGDSGTPRGRFANNDDRERGPLRSTFDGPAPQRGFQNESKRFEDSDAGSMNGDNRRGGFNGGASGFPRNDGFSKPGGGDGRAAKNFGDDNSNVGCFDGPARAPRGGAAGGFGGRGGFDGGFDENPSGRGDKCFKCSKEGHRAKDCPEGGARERDDCGRGGRGGFGGGRGGGFAGGGFAEGGPSRFGGGFDQKDDGEGFGSRGFGENRDKNEEKERGFGNVGGRGGFGGGNRGGDRDGGFGGGGFGNNNRGGDREGFGGGGRGGGGFGENRGDRESGFGGGRGGGFGGGDREGRFGAGRGGDFGGGDREGGFGGGRGGGFVGGGAGDRGCHKCGEPGHKKFDCPQNGGGGGSSFGGGDRPVGRGCFSCGEEGHRKFECPQGDSRNGGEGGGRPFGSSSFGGGDRGGDGGFGGQQFRGGREPPKNANPDFYPELPDVEELFRRDKENAEGLDRDADGDVVVTGVEDVKIMKDWEEDSEIDGSLLQNIIDRAGFAQPRKIQSAVIPVVIKGHDLLAQADIGSGKTLAFVTPILDMILKMEKPRKNKYLPSALIITPTRELAYQIYEILTKFADNLDIKTLYCVGNVNRTEIDKRIAMGVDVVVGTPGRLFQYFVKEGKMAFRSLQMVVLDEADLLLSAEREGSIPFLAEIYRYPGFTKKREAGEIQTLMFSATVTDELKETAKKYMKENFAVVSAASRLNKRLTLKFVKTEDIAEKQEALTTIFEEEIKEKEEFGKTLVFVKKREDCDFIAAFWSQDEQEDKFKVASINSDLPVQQRLENFEKFRNGELTIVIGTDVCARGLDVHELDRVIVFDMPASDFPTFKLDHAMDIMLHRIGRTGRTKPGIAYIMVQESTDQKYMKRLKALCEEAKQEVPEFLAEFAEKYEEEVPSQDGFGGFGGGDAAATGGFGCGFGSGAAGGGFGAQTTGFGAASGNTGGFGDSSSTGGFGGGFGSENPSGTTIGFGSESNDSDKTVTESKENNGFGSQGFGFGSASANDDSLSNDKEDEVEREGTPEGSTDTEVQRAVKSIVSTVVTSQFGQTGFGEDEESEGEQDNEEKEDLFQSAQETTNSFEEGHGAPRRTETTVDEEDDW